MKRLFPILFLPLLSIVSCGKAKNEIAATEKASDQHGEAVVRFQGVQERCMKLISTVGDAMSFDAVKPELEKLVGDCREVSALLGRLQPPADTRQAELRELIGEVHDRTGPTGEEVLRLVSIESREAEVIKWLESFNEAGGTVMVEMARLYGSTEYSFAISDPRVREVVRGPTETIETGWVEIDPSAWCPETHYPVIVEMMALAGDGAKYRAVFIRKPKGDFEYRSVVEMKTNEYETLNRDLSGKGFVQGFHQVVHLMHGRFHQAVWVRSAGNSK